MHEDSEHSLRKSDFAIAGSVFAHSKVAKALAALAMTEQTARTEANYSSFIEKKKRDEEKKRQREYERQMRKRCR